jgi:hypothetical protein
VAEFGRDIDDKVQAIRGREADARPIRKMLFSEYQIYIDERDLSLIE